MKIGITGHQRLNEPTRWDWVGSQIDQILSRAAAPLVGVSSLAVGADQLFAQGVLKRGGVIVAVIPFEGYVSKFDTDIGRQEFKRLLSLATTIETLSKGGSDEEAYFEAGKRVVDSSDLIVAVWNGKPADGLGGTADVVGYAKCRGKPVVHINPDDLTVGQALFLGRAWNSEA